MWRLNADRYFTSISTKLDSLRIKYVEYWTKEGLVPREINKEEATLKEYDLTIELRADSTTNAYTGICWKNDTEKLKDQENQELENIAQIEEPNSASDFLNSECKRSSYPSDYILVSELKARYNQYCKDQQVSDVLKINIVGSTEIEEFGAKFNQGFMIPYVRGIVFAHIPSLKSAGFTEGIVRIPRNLEKGLIK